MKTIEGFGFIDRHPELQDDRTLIFFRGENDSYFSPKLPINLFKTPEDAATGAQQYFVNMFKHNPHPELISAKFEIPDSLDEEIEKLSDELELVILHEVGLGYLNIVGAPVPGCERYCNTEVQASLMTDNNLTPYYATKAQTPYEIASYARSEIARQCTQSGIQIAKLKLRKDYTPGTNEIMFHGK